MDFIKEILPLFQIMQAIGIPALIYQMLKVHRKRLIYSLNWRKEDKMNTEGFKIKTSLGSFTVYGDISMNCHHFHSEKNLPQSVKTSEENYRISLWRCNIINAKTGEEISGHLKNKEHYSLGNLE